jgi:hypothetical protein
LFDGDGVQMAVGSITTLCFDDDTIAFIVGDAISGFGTHNCSSFKTDNGCATWHHKIDTMMCALTDAPKKIWTISCGGHKAFVFLILFREVRHRTNIHISKLLEIAWGEEVCDIMDVYPVSCISGK